MRLLAAILAAVLLAGGALAQEPEATPMATPAVVATPFPRPAETYSNPASGMGQIAAYLVLLAGLFGAGLWIMRNGIPTFRVGAKLERKLHIEETKSLGGRQFLVVAEYEGQKMLIGVCPGRIDHLCVLKTTPPPVFPPIAPEKEDA